jgi:hypothetical protein
MRLLLELLRAGGQNEPSKVDESESSKNPIRLCVGEIAAILF